MKNSGVVGSKLGAHSGSKRQEKGKPQSLLLR